MPSSMSRTYARRSLHSIVAHDLGTRIVSGKLAPGDVLPTEAALSESLDVSRTALREAIKILSAKGLIESRPKTGTRVKPRKSWTLLDPHLAGGRSAALLCTIAFATAFAHNYALRRNRALLGVALIYLPAPLLLPRTDESLAVGITVAAYSIYLAVVLLRSYREYQQHLDLYDALRLQRDQYERLSRIDPLTGVATRRAFGGALEHHVGEARRNGRPLAMLVLDLDQFKQVNDQHGHEAGDRALRHVAGTLRASLRATDLATRLGGEEFAILLTNTTADQAHRVAEKIRNEIESNPVSYQDQAIRLTISGGIAQFGPDGADLRSLIGRADEYLYNAKDAGRNRIISSDSVLVPCQA